MRLKRAAVIFVAIVLITAGALAVGWALHYAPGWAIGVLFLVVIAVFSYGIAETPKPGAK